MCHIWTENHYLPTSQIDTFIHVSNLTDIIEIFKMVIHESLMSFITMDFYTKYYMDKVFNLRAYLLIGFISILLKPKSSINGL